MPSKKQKRINYREPSCEVYCSKCKLWYGEEDIQFINIEEDISGRDVLTFVCKLCNTEQRSLVRGR
jgi:hypothetical protein